MLVLHPKNFSTQNHLEQICNWTNENEMLINPKNSKYMIVNFCDSFQFKTRLYIYNSLIDQVSQTRLLGVYSRGLNREGKPSKLSKKGQFQNDHIKKIKRV